MKDKIAIVLAIVAVVLAFGLAGRSERLTAEHERDWCIEQSYTGAAMMRGDAITCQRYGVAIDNIK